MKKRNHILRMAAVSVLVSMLVALLCGCGGKNDRVPETDEITLGIDVARYQGTIDWQRVAQSGVQFAMIRVGYRAQADGLIKEDPNARYNLQEASRAGLALGAYFFSTAIDEKEAKEEAAWTADILSGYPITYPVVYDCENYDDPDSRQYALTKKQRTDLALVYLETIEKQGYEGMFYGSKNDLQYDNAWDTSRIEEEYKIWVAQYPDTPYPGTTQSSYEGLHHMWQYSTTGSVPGISQAVDLNVAYFGYEGTNERKSRKEPAEAEPDVEAMIDFQEVDDLVTAKNETNLRNIPSQGEDATVIAVLKNGEVIQRIAVSPNGWSKLNYNGQICYAVSSYLTEDLSHQPAVVQAQLAEDDGIETEFRPMNQQVTAKDVVNLRLLPSVEHEDADVAGQLKNGDIATCVGISDNGWAKLEYKGSTYYAVSSYLTVPGSSASAASAESDEIQTKFEPVNQKVTAKVEVNLRSLPSVEDEDCVVIALLKNGEIVTRTGINRDVGWSRVEYKGQTVYCISSYLTEAE